MDINTFNIFIALAPPEHAPDISTPHPAGNDHYGRLPAVTTYLVIVPLARGVPSHHFTINAPHELITSRLKLNFKQQLKITLLILRLLD